MGKNQMLYFIIKACESKFVENQMKIGDFRKKIINYFTILFINAYILIRKHKKIKYWGEWDIW